MIYWFGDGYLFSPHLYGISEWQRYTCFNLTMGLMQEPFWILILKLKLKYADNNKINENTLNISVKFHAMMIWRTEYKFSFKLILVIYFGLILWHIKTPN